MRNWLSNSLKVLNCLDNNSSNSQKVIADPENKFENVLGMWWLPKMNELTFFENFNEDVYDQRVRPTKRSVLRVVMTIFDPIGLLENFVIYAKIVLQEIWLPFP